VDAKWYVKSMSYKIIRLTDSLACHLCGDP